MKIQIIRNKNCLSAVILGLISCGSALAYDSNDDSDVTRERQVSDYAQQGVHAGTFTILPKLGFGNQYMSNIYYRDKTLGGIKDSYIAHFKPGVQVNSNWNRHALNFKLDTDLALFATQPNNNDYNNIFTKLDGLWPGLTTIKKGNQYQNR